MSDVLDSYAFEPGQKVQCKTRFDDVFEGEVIAFDLTSKILILKSSATSGNDSYHDLHFLILDSVADVKILEEPPKDYPKALPSIDMKYIKERQAAAKEKRLRVVEAVGNGVSIEGITVLTELSKTFDVTLRDKNKIVVMNTVIISPPYKEANCEPYGSDKGGLDYVKKLVSKIWATAGKKAASQGSNSTIAAATSTTSSTSTPTTASSKTTPNATTTTTTTTASSSSSTTTPAPTTTSATT